MVVERSTAFQTVPYCCQSGLETQKIRRTEQGKTRAEAGGSMNRHARERQSTMPAAVEAARLLPASHRRAVKVAPLSVRGGLLPISGTDHSLGLLLWLSKAL